ncbi:MAG TPA: hypothetical protein VGQ62_16405 [Chloroflexota bacterium]|jgi:hypothetical protein|nr:hypothetical protein [Chloroflexota bacterium]
MPFRLVLPVRTLLAAAVLLAAIPPVTVSAAPPPCPLAADTLVAQSVGGSVYGGIMTDFLTDNPLDTGPGKTVCWWDTDTELTVTLSRETNAFGPGGSTTPTEYAMTVFRIPDEARAEVDLLRQNGISDIQIPTFQLTNASGLGDSAVWVYQNDPSLNIPSAGYVVKRGADAFLFGVIGLTEAEARPKASAFAQAVLSSQTP